ncbi:MAG TPA: TonB-dependent siderophore receptor [Candidatus Tectomicrobia bacterium]|nr:TonB-dependent siderophore receptor [Candidatus Tectomicrobia bacterium]
MSRRRTRQHNRSTHQNSHSTRMKKPRNRKRPHKVVAPTVALTVALTGANALAQDKDVLTAPPVEVREQRPGYTVPSLGLSRLPEPIRDIPQSITVVPQELMQQQGVSSLQDALRNVTGISFQAGEGGGAQGDNLSLRGFNARNDFFLDGVRDQGSYFRDVFNIEAVEVLKGPSALYFGRGTTGGVINQVSKLPRLESFYGGTLSLGNGFLFRVTGDVNQRINETTAFRVNFMGHLDEIVGRDEVEDKRMGIAPSVTFGLGTSTQLTLSYFLQHEDNIPDYGLPFLFGKPPDVRRENFYGLAREDTEDTWVNIGTLRLDHRFNEQLSLRNTLRYSRVDREAFPSPPRISGTPTPDTPLSQIVVAPAHPGRDTTEDILDNQTDLIARFATLSFKHTLVTGLEIGTEDFDATRFAFSNIPTTPLLDPNPVRDTSRMTRSVSAMTETSTFLFGVYATDTIKLLPQLDLVGGVRWDLFEAEFKNRITGDKFDRTDKMWSYRAGLVFHPWPTHSYYFSAGNSFNPSAEALALAANNADTAPEENQTYEFGGKVDVLGGGLSLQAALFRTEKTNARTPDPVTGLQVLEGKQRVQGFELGVVGRPLPSLNVFLGYTYLDSEILESNEVVNGVSVVGNEMPNAPEHSFSVWTSYDFLERWQVGTGIYYVGERFANNANTNVAPGHVRWDMSVGYQINKNIQLRLNAINLTDELYFDGVHPSHIIPGAGRTFIATGIFNF